MQEGAEVLTILGAVCASFACELFLKFVVFKETGKQPRSHLLADLYEACNAEAKATMAVEDTGIVGVIRRKDTQFLNARYHHEVHQVSFRQQELLQLAELLSRVVREHFESEGA